MFAEPVDIDKAKMEVAILGRAFDCKARTARDLGVAGFDKDRKFLASAPAEDAFKTPPEESLSREFLAKACDPAFKAKDEDLMSLDDAWDDALDTFLFADLEALTRAMPETKPKP